MHDDHQLDLDEADDLTGTNWFDTQSSPTKPTQLSSGPEPDQPSFTSILTPQSLNQLIAFDRSSRSSNFAGTRYATHLAARPRRNHLHAPTSVPFGMWSPSSSHTPSASTPRGPLFLPSLISPSVASSLPEKYTIRPLQRSDYAAGFLDVLRVLTTVGEIDEKGWNGHYDFMAKRDDTYYIVVVEDGQKKIVGCGTLVVERKFIHNLGKVGHIEDIAVAKDQQGKKLGLRIIQALDYISEKVGCYKSILDCSEANEGFYVKCGYKRAGLEMAHYYDPPEDSGKAGTSKV